MRRRLRLALLAITTLLPACGGEPVARQSPAPTASPSASAPASPTMSPSQEPSPTPTATPVIQPKGLPTEFPKDLPPGDLPLEQMVPPESLVTGSWYVPAAGGVGEQVVIAYTSGEDPDPFATGDGLAVWQQYPDRPAWRAVQGFFDPAPKGVLGIDVPAVGDVTGDRHDDVLTMESTGGSGACGIWRVLATDLVTGVMSELFRRESCDTGVTLDGARLVITEAVFEPGDAHCCPSVMRTTTMRWAGDRWKVTGRETAPA